MTGADDGQRIWLGDDHQLGIPDLTAAGWERRESPDYAVIFVKEGASAFAIRVRGPAEVDDVADRWKRVHAVPLEAVHTTTRRVAGYDAVEHEAPCEESMLLRTVVVRTKSHLIDIGQLAPDAIDHRPQFEEFLKGVRLRRATPST